MPHRHHLDRTTLVGLLAAAWTCLFAANANATELARTTRPSHAEAVYSYEFDDDDLLAALPAPVGERLRIRDRRGRVMLLRPRVHFVDSMLQSIEDL